MTEKCSKCNKTIPKPADGYSPKPNSSLFKKYGDVVWCRKCALEIKDEKESISCIQCNKKLKSGDTYYSLKWEGREIMVCSKKCSGEYADDLKAKERKNQEQKAKKLKDQKNQIINDLVNVLSKAMEDDEDISSYGWKEADWLNEEQKEICREYVKKWEETQKLKNQKSEPKSSTVDNNSNNGSNGNSSSDDFSDFSRGNSGQDSSNDNEDNSQNSPSNSDNSNGSPNSNDNNSPDSSSDNPSNRSNPKTKFFVCSCKGGKLGFDSKEEADKHIQEFHNNKNSIPDFVYALPLLILIVIIGTTVYLWKRKRLKKKKN